MNWWWMISRVSVSILHLERRCQLMTKSKRYIFSSGIKRLNRLIRRNACRPFFKTTANENANLRHLDAAWAETWVTMSKTRPQKRKNLPDSQTKISCDVQDAMAKNKRNETKRNKVLGDTRISNAERSIDISWRWLGFLSVANAVIPIAWGNTEENSRVVSGQERCIEELLWWRGEHLLTAFFVCVFFSTVHNWRVRNNEALISNFVHPCRPQRLCTSQSR